MVLEVPGTDITWTFNSALRAMEPRWRRRKATGAVEEVEPWVAQAMAGVLLQPIHSVELRGDAVWLHVLKPMRGWEGTPRGKATVGQVCNSLGEGTEEGGAIRPAHGEGKGEGDEWLFTGVVGHNDAEKWDGRGRQGDAVVAVGQITFECEDGDKGRVGVIDVL
jgi:hypothetical protein